MGGRRALLGLWCVQGIGPQTLATLEASFSDLDVLLTAPIEEWAALIKLRAQARAALARFKTLDAVAADAEERLARAQIRVAFKTDPAYPRNLAELSDAPPMLFHWGLGDAATARRRLAMVGTRHPENGFNRWAHAFAQHLALTGVGIISGAAEGVDQACHHGALQARGETWAFLGSGLDELDPSQAALWPYVRDGNGTYFSEFPPGARGDKSTFPRRNRLISGSADAVLVLRAGASSGALYTANYALEQQRPLLALPGDPFNPAAAGSNALVRDGKARLCVEVEDLTRVLGMGGLATAAPAHSTPAGKLEDFSLNAQRAFSLLTKHSADFDALYALWGAGSGELSSALVELELAGWIVQRPGRRYEKI